MDDPDSVANLMDSTSSKIQQLQKAFAELESHRAITLNLKWKELEEHFHGLERSLKRRFHELEDQEKEFKTKTRKARELLEKREADVLAKEHVSLERLQENRDAAATAIANALQKHRKISPAKSAVINCCEHFGSPSVEDEQPDSLAAENSSEEVRASSDGNSLELSHPQLVKLCEEMDSEGMHKFISDNRKNLSVLREEVPLALKAAPNPAQLLLNSLDNFYPGEASNIDCKKDSGLLGLRRTCIMLLECLSILLLNSDEAYVTDVLSADIKEQAKAIADEWKPKLDALSVDDSNGNSLEAHAFLQLLATFDIASGFDEDVLCRLIPMVSRRRQAAELCRFLGLSEKMPGIIEVLVNSGRHIDAVNLAFAFELTEQFSPVPLLKSYLREARKSSTVKPGNMSPTTVQNEVNERELTALKAVIKCIEEHKLEEQYPLDPLQKRLILIEKAKADKKSTAEVAKPQPKRPRANGMGCGPRITGVAAEKPFYSRVADRHPQQYVYDSRAYGYPPADNHMPLAPLVGPTTYSFTPSQGNYFGNGYQYPAPYLH